MNEKVFKKEQWLEALSGIGEEFRVLVPTKAGDLHEFKPLPEAKSVDFAYRNTRLSPKGLVYPHSERMFTATLDQGNPRAGVYEEAPKDFAPTAVVGIRPCDAHAFSLVKLNFDNPEYKDPWWVRRFEATTLIGLGCNEPCPTCFCTSVGGGPFSEKGLDALLFDLGDSFLVKPLTKKGEDFLSRVEGGEAASKELLQKTKKLAAAAEKNLPPAFPMNGAKDRDALEIFKSPLWEDVAFACVNCGTCTFLCPTCWCFDIQDEVAGKESDRIRNWDSCMFPLFTLHGSGHNPRKDKFQRVRQRFMHKLKYFLDKYQQGVQCSGCGRCVRACPVNIDIRQVAEKINSI